MKFKHISPLLIAGIVGVNSVPALGESEAPLDLSFSCQIDNGVPVTVVQGQESQQSIFHWDRANLPESADSEIMCQEVAMKLNGHAAIGEDVSNLNFISSAAGSYMPTICATQGTRECSILLLTLPLDEKPLEAADLFLSSIIDKDLAANKFQPKDPDRGFQGTVYPVDFWTLVFGRKFLK